MYQNLKTQDVKAFNKISIGLKFNQINGIKSKPPKCLLSSPGKSLMILWDNFNTLRLTKEPILS